MWCVRLTDLEKGVVGCLLRAHDRAIKLAHTSVE